MLLIPCANSLLAVINGGNSEGLVWYTNMAAMSLF